MRLKICAWFLSVVAVLGTCAVGVVAARADEPPAVQLATLMRAQLEGVDSTEVIVSMVEIPPSKVLPTHYHPGEEFVYVLEGSGIVHLKGEPDVHLKAGDVFKVPLEHVHSAEAGEKGVKALVFRVHRTGRPERVLVE